LAGQRRRRDGVFTRARFLCIYGPAESDRHWFSLPRRRPTHIHPYGEVCPACDRETGRTDGPIARPSFSHSVSEIAQLLILVGQGVSQRRASQEVRFAAQRFTIDRHGNRTASRQNSLAADYLDHYAHIVLEQTAPARWPAILVLDSRPLKVRPYGVDDLPFRQRPAAPDRGGAILVAAGTDDPQQTSRAWRIGLAGDETGESWFDFLSELPGDPAWVVFDGSGAIGGAVQARWPSAVAYSCEWHLWQNAEGSAYADGAYDKALAELIRVAQWNVPNWERLVSAVDAQAMPVLGGWIARNDQLVRRQIDLRARFRHFPRSNGAAERAIRAVEELIDKRRFNFRNARRLRLILALIRNQLAGEADPLRYTRILRDQAHAALGKAEAWAIHHDHGAPVDRLYATKLASLPQLIVDAHNRGQGATRAYNAGAKLKSLELKLIAENTARAAAGQPPLKLVSRPGSATDSVDVTGLTLEDFPGRAAEWDAVKNGAIAGLRASSDRKVWWRCANGHEWQAKVVDRTKRLTKCRACYRYWVDDSTSLASQWPELVGEWDEIANGLLTPDKVKFTHAKTVWWRCLRNPSHGSYHMSPRTRGATDVGCPVCRREAAEAKKRRRQKPPQGRAHSPF
jgi:hypothetical protein